MNQNWLIYLIHNLLVPLVGISATGGIDRATFWEFVIAVLTALLFWIAFVQLGTLNKTTTAEFNHKLTEDFFTREARSLVFLIENKWLIFNDYSKFENKASFFSFQENEATRSMKIKKIFTTNEVDDFILGPLEDLAIWEGKGLLDMDMVYGTFGGYLMNIWKNKEIRRYIDYVRNDKEVKDSKLIYKGMEKLFNKCESYMKAKLEKRLWLWKFGCWCRKFMFWKYFSL